MQIFATPQAKQAYQQHIANGTPATYATKQQAPFSGQVALIHFPGNISALVYSTWQGNNARKGAKITAYQLTLGPSIMLNTSTPTVLPATTKQNTKAILMAAHQQYVQSGSPQTFSYIF
jgi:hypothetical protein